LLLLFAIVALEASGFTLVSQSKSTRQWPFAAATGDSGERVGSVLVSGATGGVGRLVVDALVRRGRRVKALVRDKAKAYSVFPSYDPACVELVVGDLSETGSLPEDLFEEVDSLVCCSAATVRAKCDDASNETIRYFNGVPYFEPEVVGQPQQIDYEGTRALVRGMVEARPDLVGDGSRELGTGTDSGRPRVVYVSSSGVTRPKDPTVDLGSEPPVVRMNDVLGGVLSWKFEAERAIRESGLPYSIIRPCALVDGAPGSNMVVDQGDALVGMISRATVADLCVHALDCAPACFKTFEVRSSPPNLQGTASSAAEVLDAGSSNSRVDFQGLFQGLALDALIMSNTGTQDSKPP